MIKLKETVLVEGKYDKARLSNFIDANIIETDGFAIFSDKKRIELLKSLAKKDGLIILTDSDSAGFKIRNYVASCMGEIQVYHAYIPEILGKEKRKTIPSKEGLLGVEGVDDEIILNALKKSGIKEFNKDSHKCLMNQKITAADLYNDGILGRENSAAKKEKLLEYMGFPKKINAKSLVRILNSLYTYDRYKKIIKDISNQ